MDEHSGDTDQTGPKPGLERRSFVALLFADLSDYTALGESSDPEEIIELRHEVEGVARAAISRAGGEINQFTGDGLLAVFGLVEVDEDAVRHAIEASIDLHEAIRGSQWKTHSHAGFRVRFHSGVHSGLVFARRGDPLHGKYELTGDTVNTAARLCSAAQRDEILVSSSALRGFESYFDVEPVAPLLLKGKRRPVSAYRVKGRSDVRTRFEAQSRRGLTPFVGRVDILDTIERELIGAEARGGSALCLVGDAGLGKTRLLNEVARRARALGFQVHHGGCESYGGVVPLRPFLQIAGEGLTAGSAGSEALAAQDLERHLIALDPALAVHLSALLHLFAIQPWPFDGGPRDAQVTVIAALTDLVIALARHQPTLLLLDDWQWADRGSAQVLGQLLRALPQTPIRILLGARAIEPNDAVLGQMTALELPPFTEQESLDVVASLASAAVDRHSAQRVHLRSGGNPLFLEELCGSLLPQLQTSDALTAEVPATLNGLIHARIARLEPEHARVLRGASVIGNEFVTWLLAEAVSHSAIDTVLTALVGSGLLYSGFEPGSFRFKHGITREVIYESVRLHERRELHSRIARALEQRFAEAGLVDQYERLASHYAGAADYSRALEFADRAGDKAALASALDSARVQYAAAMAHIDHLGSGYELRRRWLEIAAKWARVCIFNPAPDQLPILAHAVEYAEDLRDENAVAYAEYWIGWIEYALGNQDTAIQHLQRALLLAERSADQPLLAQIQMNLGQCHAASAAYGPALELLSRGIEMRRTPAGTRRGTSPAGLAYALGCQALVVGERGDFATAYTVIGEGFDLIRGTGNAVEGSLLCLLGMLQLWQGRWQEAVETAIAGRVTAERVIGPYVFAMCRLIGSYGRWKLDASAAALDELRGAVDWLDRRDIRLYLSFGLGHLADAMLEAGEPASARDYAERALLRAKQTDPIGSAMAHRTLARLALIDGQTQRARELCEGALRVAHARGSARELALAGLSLGELELGLGAADQAVPFLEGAGAEFDRMRMSWHHARGRRLPRRLQAPAERRPKWARRSR